MKKSMLFMGMVLMGASSLAIADSLFVDASGNVGVGVDATNPATEKFHVMNGNLRVQQGDVAAKIIFSTQAQDWEIVQNPNTGQLKFTNGIHGGSFKFNPTAVVDLLRVGTLAPDTVDVNGKLVVNDVQIADYVFSPEYELKSIDEQAEFMWKNKHLPAVQPGDENQRANIDVMANQMAILEELEKAHIYISQLNNTIKEMKSELNSLKVDASK